MLCRGMFISIEKFSLMNMDELVVEMDIGVLNINQILSRMR